MSSTPISIRYYNLINDGIGITIFPEILTPGGDKLWNGRNHDGYSINVGDSRSVDLTVCDMDTGTLFVLSENTLFGEDMTESSPIFSFDPNSTNTATAVRRGGADSGSLEYAGTSS